MPSKQRQRQKRRTVAKVKQERRLQEAGLSGEFEGEPIFTEEDIAIEDERLIGLLQSKQKQKQKLTEDDAIYLTDILDFDDEMHAKVSKADEDVISQFARDGDTSISKDEAHQSMLESMFGGMKSKPKIAGNQMEDSAYAINDRDADADDANDTEGLDKPLRMSDMFSKDLNIPVSKVVQQQIAQYEDSQQLARLKLHAQTSISDLTVERKERGLAMTATKKKMEEWAQPIARHKEDLGRRSKLVPPKPNMMTFIGQMSYSGEFGNQLSKILADFGKDHDLDDELSKQQKKPSKQEVRTQAKRLRQLRHQIASQLRESRRVKKIKSKSFRRRLRARKARIEPDLEELRELDPKLYDREVRKLERQRAQERITMKHKNTSKWAQHLLRRSRDNKNKIDLESRRALMEQLERGQELKRKIRGHTSDDDDENGYDSSDTDDKKNGKNRNNERNHANGAESFETEVEAKKKALERKEEEIAKSGVWGMQFMKRAETKRKEQIKELTQQMRQARSLGRVEHLEREIGDIEKNATEVHLDKKVEFPNNFNNFKGKKNGRNPNMRNGRQNFNNNNNDNNSYGLGKRKFGAGGDEKGAAGEEEDGMPRRKRQRTSGGAEAVLPLDASDLVANTQQISQAAFGATAKSLIRLDNIDNADEGEAAVVTEDTLDARNVLEPVFEVLEAPRLGKTAPALDAPSAHALRKDGTRRDDTAYSYQDRVRREERIKRVEGDVQQINADTTEPMIDIGKFLEKSEADAAAAADAAEAADAANGNATDAAQVADKNTEWQVVVPASELLGRKKKVRFGGKQTQKRQKQQNRQLQPKTKRFDDRSNPWLNQSNNDTSGAVAGAAGTSRNGRDAGQEASQRDTAILDPNAVELAGAERSEPDFNLFASNDPKQIELIYNTLHGGEEKKVSSGPVFSKVDDVAEEFAKMKNEMVGLAMPDKPQERLEGWDEWTGMGIKKDPKKAKMIDPEYTRNMVEWEKERAKRMEQRKDRYQRNVILSERISKESSKYVVSMRNSPSWFQPWKYEMTRRENIGREWNMATQFNANIRDEHDIPQGFVVHATKRKDKTEPVLGKKAYYGDGSGRTRRRAPLPKLVPRKPQEDKFARPDREKC